MCSCGLGRAGLGRLGVDCSGRCVGSDAVSLLTGSVTVCCQPTLLWHSLVYQALCCTAAGFMCAGVACCMCNLGAQTLVLPLVIGREPELTVQGMCRCCTPPTPVFGPSGGMQPQAGRQADRHAFSGCQRELGQHPGIPPAQWLLAVYDCADETHPVCFGMLQCRMLSVSKFLT